MEKCPQCSYRKTQVNTFRDKNGFVVRTEVKCKNCGHILRSKNFTVVNLPEDK